MPVGSIASDSAVTALLYWQGKLFVGCADRIIKVGYTFYSGFFNERLTIHRLQSRKLLVTITGLKTPLLVEI